MYKTIINFLFKDENNNKIFIKRDDLLPFSFGGNKVRIANEFFEEMEKKSKDCIIGYGSSSSNLNRVIASMAYCKQIPCYIISPADKDNKRIETNNSIFVKNSNAILYHCTRSEVAETVDKVMNLCYSRGLLPYYIYGNQHGIGNEVTPLNAYKKVYNEIQIQSREMKEKFDYIFLATGTGMTQAGLQIGKILEGGTEEIIGISIARKSEEEKKIINNYINLYLNNGNDSQSISNKINVIDKYLCEGYGNYTVEIEKVIYEMFYKYGIPLDCTYTGKAFYGMKDYLIHNKIKDKKVLFIHTGGTPLFFDYTKKFNKIHNVINCKDEAKILNFLQTIDSRLPVKLSSRTNLTNLVAKVLKFGHVLTIEENNEIVSAVFFYCNDTENNNAYITLLATLESYEGNGYANSVMNAMEKMVKNYGMKTIHLDTDKTNNYAISFYSRRNYLIHSIEDKIHMVKEI